MQFILKYKIYLFFFSFILFESCSTTKKLPEGEVLYTGIKTLQINGPSGQVIDPEAKSQVLEALEIAPNNSLFGSSSKRIPFPFGLWMYNWFKTDKEKGFKRWLFNKLAAKPVLISNVEPAVRSKAAQTLMNDNGYFYGKVRYEIIPNSKNPRKAKISYFVDFPTPYRYSSITYMKVETPSDSIFRTLAKSSVLKVGEIFNVNHLEEERSRISDTLRNNGYYYFRPDFVSYVADSTEGNHQIALRVLPKTDLPSALLKPWQIGQINYKINSSINRKPEDSLFYRQMGVFYYRKSPVRSRVLYNALTFHPGDWYSQDAANETQLNLNRLNTFKYVELNYMPQDTIHQVDSLRVDVETTLDLPIDAEIELNITTKSNDQTGPGLVFGITRRNIFRGGEVLNTELRGSYEWQTGSGAKNTSGQNLINSYEFGVTSSLIFPRLIAPKFIRIDKKYATTTTFKIRANLLNRSGFFRLLTLGGLANYDYKSSKVSTHTITPFSLSYSYLIQKTAAFDSVININKALAQSFENQFIPSIGYTYTYDDASILSKRNHIWWQSSIMQAGNILYGAMELFGNKQGNQKTLFGSPYSQFVKATSEIRYYYMVKKKHIIASRFLIGAIKPYLNSTIAPYSEQYFIGGANSIRAFTVRSIGPGSFRPDPDALYSYLDQTGNLKLEANVEYRFPLIGNLNGAFFLDAGNVWLFKKDISRPGGNFAFKTFGKDIALGTGMGLRFDITYIVLRFDIGVPLHAPYDTGKTGYYNIQKFFPSLAYHLAIGYPF